MKFGVSKIDLFGQRLVGIDVLGHTDTETVGPKDDGRG